jgi:glycine/D-amino acid oxidase-like deaminating enzyme
MSTRAAHPIIVGGGLVGLGTAWQILRGGRARDLTLLEKESRVGAHQSTHNSGVLHAGLYYKPGSLKARLAVDGIREMTAYCVEKNIPHEICGKVVVAVDETEVPRLRALEERGQANGLGGLRWLDRDALRAIEPHAAGVAALHVPEEGIVDYAAVCEALRADIAQMGGQIVTGVPRFARCAKRPADGPRRPRPANTRVIFSSTARGCSATASAGWPERNRPTASFLSAGNTTNCARKARTSCATSFIRCRILNFPSSGCTSRA